MTDKDRESGAGNVIDIVKFIDEKEAVKVAKGRAEEWQEEEKLLLLEGWARDGLTDD